MYKPMSNLSSANPNIQFTLKMLTLVCLLVITFLTKKHISNPDNYSSIDEPLSQEPSTLKHQLFAE